MTITTSLRSLLKKAIREDLGAGDITTQTLIPGNQRGEGVIVAKQAGIFCGGPVAAEVFRQRDRALRVKIHAREGAPVKKGRKVLTVRGRMQSILEAERVALNFLGHLSGIATLTRAYVERVRGTRARIYDTRKTTPLWRELEKYAVKCGGGENHRSGLFDEVLVKDNHWAAVAQSLRAPILRHRRKIGTKQSLDMDCFVAPPKLAGLLAMTAGRRKIPIEIEVRNLKELAHLLEGPFVPDRILVDNFSVSELRGAVLFVRGLDRVLRASYGIRRRVPELEASGGMDLKNVRAVAQTGVDRISVGRLTHSAPALDFSLHVR